MLKLYNTIHEIKLSNFYLRNAVIIKFTHLPKNSVKLLIKLQDTCITLVS